MARPKVLPQNRRRIGQACQPCHRSKRRCDGQKPCRVCRCRKLEDACTYTSSSDRSTVDVHIASPQTSRTLPVRHNGHIATVDDGQAPRLSGRMLLNGRGERVYVNSVSGLSLLHYLKITLKDRMGRSSFADEPENDSILDDADQISGSEPFELSPEKRAALVQSYKIVTGGIIDIYSHDELEVLITQGVDLQNSHETLQDAALSLVLAIGAQSQPEDVQNSKFATATFAYARRIAFKKQLEDTCLDLVRVFILISFYMVGACRRHAAVMAIGIAATGSIMLGLHDTEQYAKFDTAEGAARWRTYRSLLVMDFTNATLLGRPMVVPPLSANKPAVSISATKNTDREASFDICTILHREMTKSPHDLRLGPLEALHVVEELQCWARRWKEQQRDSHPPSVNHAIFAVRLHSSCIYYHALVLATRSSLVDLLTERVMTGTQPNPVQSDALKIQLHETCIEAAICMAETCHDAHSTGCILSNQCHILRPVLFESGIVLGFAMAVSNEILPRVDHAFRQIRKILKFLAATSALARKFYNMLSGLFDAITLQRIEKARKETSNPLPVEKLLEFETQKPSTVVRSTPRATSATISTTSNSTNNEFQSPNELQPLPDFDEEWQIFTDQVAGLFPSESLNFLFDNI